MYRMKHIGLENVLTSNLVGQLYNEILPRSSNAAHPLRESGHATKHGLLIQDIPSNKCSNMPNK